MNANCVMTIKTFFKDFLYFLILTGCCVLNPSKPIWWTKYLRVEPQNIGWSPIPPIPLFPRYPTFICMIAKEKFIHAVTQCDVTWCHISVWAYYRNGRMRWSGESWWVTVNHIISEHQQHGGGSKNHYTMVLFRLCRFRRWRHNKTEKYVRCFFFWSLVFWICLSCRGPRPSIIHPYKDYTTALLLLCKSCFPLWDDVYCCEGMREGFGQHGGNLMSMVINWLDFCKLFATGYILHKTIVNSTLNRVANKST